MAVKQLKNQLLFHGTSLNRLKEIVKTGYLGTNNSIWDVSENCTTYFWTESYIREEEEIEDQEEIKNRGIQLALESAAFSLAQEKQNLRRVVLIFKSEDIEKLGFKLLEDKSCKENMDHCLCCYGAIPINLAEIWIDKQPLDYYGLYFLGLALDRNKQAEKSQDGTYNVNIEYPDSNLEEAALKVYECLNDFFMENMELSENLKLLFSIDDVKNF